MLTYNFGDLCYQIAQDGDLDEDFKLDTFEELEWEAQSTFRLFTRRKLFRELMMAHSIANNLRGYALVHAHGGDTDGIWTTHDESKRYAVQEIIDKFDGNVSTILLKCCNPGGLEITSKKSIIIHPNSALSSLDLMLRRKKLRLYYPGRGYLENNYRALRRTIDELMLPAEQQVRAYLTAAA